MADKSKASTVPRAPIMPADLRNICSEQLKHMCDIFKDHLDHEKTIIYRASKGQTDYYLVDLLLEICILIGFDKLDKERISQLRKVETWIIELSVGWEIADGRGDKYDKSNAKRR